MKRNRHHLSGGLSAAGIVLAVCSLRGLVLIAAPLVGREAEQQPELRAAPLSGEIHLDGLLDEPAWAEAESIEGLTMVEPTEGEAPSASTRVRVLANSSEVLFGIEADDPDPAGVVAFSVERDAGLRNEDHVRVVLDPFLSGRTGLVIAINPRGARYDALVVDGGEDASWDAVWDANTARTSRGWSAEIRIPIRSITFDPTLDRWGFNVQRRIQRLQETDRWASASQNYEITQTSQAGILSHLPRFDLGLGLKLRPFASGAGRVAAPGAPLDGTTEFGGDIVKLWGGLESTLTINTDFGETEVDARQVNLTRFPLFFPEKRAFFLQGSDIFGFGLGLGTNLVPFFSRRIGLLDGQEVPIDVGGKLSGRVAGTSIGALVVRTRETAAAPGATMGVVRLKQDVLAESSVGAFMTVGDSRARDGSWLAGTDFTFQTSQLGGDKNFLVGVWGLAMGRDDLQDRPTAFGFQVDYPNDLWDATLTYRRIDEEFEPSLGFVRRPGTQQLDVAVNYSPRPQWRWVRQMFFESGFSLVTDIAGNLESWRLFTAPVNWRLESGDRFEFNVVPQGERLMEPFEVAEGVIIPAGAYDWTRYRLEMGTASKRALSGQITWWFGRFFGGTLNQLELGAEWNPAPLLTVGLSAEHNVGSLPQGDFTEDLVQLQLRLKFSPDMTLSSFIQYDNISDSLGSNTRLRWRFDPGRELFIIYNYNLRDDLDRGFRFQSAEFLAKLSYELRF